MIQIYADGSCHPNPGRGGCAAILLKDGKRFKEMVGWEDVSTNNRMELMGAITGLRCLKVRSTVTVFSDSKYVVNAMTKGWANRWRKRKWRRGKKGRGKVVPNRDLWTVLLDLCGQHDVTFLWVRGHDGDHWNTRADELAGLARESSLGW